MDPRELRIGNYVQANGELVKVVAIDSKNEDDIEIKNAAREVIRVKMSHLKIEPVRLDLEVLHKCCGFSLDGLLPFTHEEREAFLKINNGHVILLCDKQQPMIHFWNITCLHQLQNLYYCLQGKEMCLRQEQPF